MQKLFALYLITIGALHSILLKQFLKLWDNLPVFEEIKAEGRVGIPCLVKEDGTIVFDWRSLLGDAAETVAAPVQGQACSLDGKNC